MTIKLTIVFLRHFIFTKQMQQLVVLKFLQRLVKLVSIPMPLCVDPPEHLAAQDFFIDTFNILS